MRLYAVRRRGGICERKKKNKDTERTTLREVERGPEEGRIHSGANRGNYGTALYGAHYARRQRSAVGHPGCGDALDFIPPPSSR